MPTDEIAAKAPLSMNFGPVPTVVLLSLATYGAGTLATQVGIVTSSFIRSRKTRKALAEKQNNNTE